MNTAQKKELSPEGTTSEGVGIENIIYTRRFSQAEDDLRVKTWQILCRDFFQKYVPAEATVLDIGAGDGLFSKNIRAKRRIAVDISDHARKLESSGIEVVIAPATELPQHIKEPVDIVFMSNFLEHMPNKQVLLEVIAASYEVLAPGGKVLILQPNVRYAGAAYWDYIDHHIALTEHSLQEALEISGFQVTENIARFLPYTVKSKVGTIARLFGQEKLVETYLKLPFLWKFLGHQTFIVGEKPS